MAIFQPSRALIVDDDSSTRTTFTYALKNKYLEVETASSGREALRLLETKRFDVVFLDFQMPGIHGFELLQILNDQYPDLRVVVASASLTRLEIEMVSKYFSVARILEKPVAPEDLRSCVPSPSS